MGTPKDSEQTKRKLIQVAGELFALHGYTQVTVRHIIEAANANLGALNYHFGTKECLYGEVLKHACQNDKIDVGLLVQTSPREQLVFIVSEALATCSLPIEQNWPYMLIKRECQFPTNMFNELTQAHFTFQSEVLTRIIGALVERKPSEPEVQLGLVTMVGLIDAFGLNRHLIISVLPDLLPYVDDREALAERVVDLVASAAR